MEKRTFLLLEILIAFTLVLICAIPLVKQPLKLYKSEMEHLVRMEQERLADWTFTEIKELLIKNEIPWEKIPEKGNKTGPFPLPSATIEIPECPPKTIERSFLLSGEREKAGLNNQLYRQLNVCILLNQKKYPFILCIQKLFAE